MLSVCVQEEKLFVEAPPKPKGTSRKKRQRRDTTNADMLDLVVSTHNFNTTSLSINDSSTYNLIPEIEIMTQKNYLK